MPVNIEWYDESQGIALYRMLGRWTVDEALTSLDKIIRLASVSPIYYIVDLTESLGVPSNLFTSSRLVASHLKLREGLTLVLGANPVAYVFLTSLVKLGVLYNLHFVSSYEEAEDAIRKHQQSQ